MAEEKRGCPKCGSTELHACPGYPIPPWTPEKIAELHAVLAEYETEPKGCSKCPRQTTYGPATCAACLMAEEAASAIAERQAADLANLEDVRIWLVKSRPPLTLSTGAWINEYLSALATVEALLSPAQQATPEGGHEPTPQFIDQHLDAILRAAGSSLNNYSMPLMREGMRKALRDAIEAGREL